MATEKRLIDANALKETVITDYYEHFTRYHDTDQIALIDMVCDDIDETSTVDAVEVVHGRWEDEYGGAFTNPRYRCSVCKEKALYRYERNNLGGWEAIQALTDYCPNCGAKMDGANDDG